MPTLVDNVTGADVAKLLGRESDDSFVDGLGSVAADLARDAASSYCRGAGFDDPDRVPSSLRWVVLLRAVRFVENPNQLANQSTDGASLNYGPAAQGWSIHELVSLDEYRRTAGSIPA